MNRRQRERNAKIKRAIICTPVFLLTALFLVGLLLPSIHRERQAVAFANSPETLWSVLTDLDALPRWRTDLADVERLPPVGGSIRWREVDRSGRQEAFEQVEAAPPNRLVIRAVSTTANPSQSKRLDLASGATVGRGGGRSALTVWIYEIRSEDRTKTWLSVTEERRVSNPIARTVVGLFGANRRRLDRMVRDLGQRLIGRRAADQVRLAASDH